MDDLRVLAAARLTLGCFTETDIPRLGALCGDRAIAATTLAISYPDTEDDARGWGGG